MGAGARHALVALITTAFAVAPAHADPASRAVAMLRVLAYDKHLAAGDDVRIVIVYPKGKTGSAESARWSSAFGSARKLKVDGRPIVVSSYQFASEAELDHALGDSHAAALIACDGLTQAIPAHKLAALGRVHKVLTIATTETDVASGLAVGVVAGARNDEILINAAAVHDEGVQFDAGLLQLARAVERKP